MLRSNAINGRTEIREEVYGAFVRPAADTSNLRGIASIIEAILNEQRLDVYACHSDGDCTIRLDVRDHTLTLRRPDAEHLEFQLRPHYTDIDNEAADTLKLLMRKLLTLVDPEEIAWLSRESTVAADTFRSVVAGGEPRRVVATSSRKPKLPKSWKTATQVARKRQADASSKPEIMSNAAHGEPELDGLREAFRAPEDAPTQVA